MQCPLDHWRDDADQEEEHETVIEPAIGEQTLRSDDTPLLHQR
jgi:hypothetical protein